MKPASNDPSLTKIQSEFPQTPLKYGVDRKTVKFDTVPDHLPRISLDMVESWTGNVIDRDQQETNISTGLVEFQSGDVLFSKLRPYLAKGFKAEYRGAGSPEFLVLRPTKFTPRFLLYLLLSEEVINRVDASTYGAKMPRASWDFIGNLRVPCPNKQNQEFIANFLDIHTSQIDALIEKKNQLVELLDEKRKSVITEVTKTGLKQDQSMKSPDTRWLDQIPSHWSVYRLDHLRDTRTPIVYGIVLPGPDQEEGVPIIKGGDCKPERLDPDLLSKTTPKIAADYQRSKLKPGELVYEIRGSVGRVVKIPPELEGANLTQDTARIAPKKNINTDWLIYALESETFRQQIDLYARGATVQGVNLFDLRRRVIPVPPEEEQNQIANYLLRADNKIQKLKDIVEEAIKLHIEKRRALITSAVTGQIDLSDWDSQEDQELPA